VLELGCGISPLTALLLAPRVARYVLTDQPYVSRMIHQNLEANPLPSSSSSSRSSSRRKKTGGGGASSFSSSPTPGVIAFQPLDWELDTPDPSLTGSPAIRSFDAVVCCDCIYNEALVAPLVSATADLARLRLREREDRAEARDSANNNALLQDHRSSAVFSSSPSPSSHADRSEPCVCIVAQQLRSPDVFEEWVRAFHRHFRVWRVPDALLPEGLRIDSGFVVHVGILRQAETDF
ncbi:hypothetical protein CTA2_10561, partial [Colletotrichum tanaceti]